MADSDKSASDIEKDEEKPSEAEKKIQRSLKSMLKQMELSNEEIQYRMENFDNVDVKKEYMKLLQCTKCGANFKQTIKKGETIGIHPLLGVLMCDTCCDYYGDGNFSLDSEGEDKYCRWCGEGGTIFACSKCICGFCAECIKKHFGETGLEAVEKDDDWICYICDSKPLWYLRSICSLANEAARNQRDQKSNDTKKKKRRKKENLDTDVHKTSSESSSGSNSSSNNSKSNEKKVRTKRKRFSKAASKIEDTSSSEDEKENHVSSRRKSFRKKKGTPEKESSGSDGKTPRKKAKTEEDPEFESKKANVLQKLTSIWKLTQVLSEVGLSRSRAKLKSLAKPEDYGSFELLKKEHEELKSCMNVLVSSLSTASNSASSIKEDLDVDTTKDETESFRSQELKLKTFADKFHEGSGGKGTVDSVGNPSGIRLGRGSRSRRSSDRSDGGENRSKSLFSDSECEKEKTKKGHEKIEEKLALGKESGSVKPLLKVKSFARMLEANVYDQEEPVLINLSDTDEGGNETKKKTEKEDTPGKRKKKKKRESQVVNGRGKSQKQSKDDSGRSRRKKKDSDSEKEIKKRKGRGKKWSRTKSESDLETVSDSSSGDDWKSSRRGKKEKKKQSPGEKAKRKTRKQSLEEKGEKTQNLLNETEEVEGKKQSGEEKSPEKEKTKKSEEEIEHEPDEEETAKKSVIEEAAKKSDEEEIAKKSDEEETAKKSDEEETAKKSDEEETAKKSDEEETAKKSDEEETAKKSDGEEIAKKSDEEETAEVSDKEEIAKNSDEESEKKSDEEEKEKSDEEKKGKSDEDEKVTKSDEEEEKEEKSDEDEKVTKSDEEAEEEKKDKKCKSDSSDIETSSSEKKRKRKTRRQKKDVKASFEKLKRKRKLYLDSSKNENDQSRDEEQEGKVSALLQSSESENENEKKETEKKKKKRILMISDEDGTEKNEEEKEESSEESEKENQNQKKSDSEPRKGTPSGSSDEELGKKARKRVKRSKGSSDSSEEEKRKKKKAKRGGSSSESSADEKEKKKKGRKNIKKILKKDSLKVETKEALKNEEERKKRLKERQKQFEELFPEEEGERKRLILDFDPETKEPTVMVHKKLVKRLKPHQFRGVKFMWDSCFESAQKMEEESGSGCILAHCMGLGKTLQVVTLVHTVMTHDLGVNSVLVVCPLSTVPNWIREFETWLENIHTDPITLYDLLKYKKIEERRFHLKDWHENGGVLVISYDLFRTLTKGFTGKQKKRKTKSMEVFRAALLDPGPDLVICDEGHLLKNEDTALSKCMSQVKTSRRIVLTGTPLQNNLIEYHCMVQFVKPNILGTRKEFCNRFVNPINNGQFEDSTDLDVKIMKRRSHVLHSMLDGCIQRFDYSVLTPFLPEKHEYVLKISLTETQSKVYTHFIDHLSAKSCGSSKATSLFHDYHSLQRIWTHPRAMLMQSERETQREMDKDSEGSLKDFVVSSGEESSRSSGSDSEDSVQEVAPTRKRILRSNANDPEVMKALEEEEKEEKKHWWDQYYSEKAYDDMRESNKLIILFSLLKHSWEQKDKVLVFSQSLYSLDLIEYFLNRINESNEDDETLCGHRETWVRGSDYFRLDGSTSSDTRNNWCKYFNKESNTRARLFLISTKAGGLGINLFGANRVVIFDASWNPSHDLQSIFRVYRFGQKKTCYIYRFLSEGTMEEKIYERQVTKLSLAHRVVDEHQIERHYTMGNLQELYTFQPTPKDQRKVPNLPKDSVLADILAQHKDLVVGYHEHDSLLENKHEEELSEEERKAAWKEYEEEKSMKVNINPMMMQAQQMMLQNQMMMQGQHEMMMMQSQQAMMQGLPERFIFSGGRIQPVLGNSGQSFINPMFNMGNIPNIPFEYIHRGMQVGLTPVRNETADCFVERVVNREAWIRAGKIHAQKRSQ